MQHALQGAEGLSALLWISACIGEVLGAISSNYLEILEAMSFI